MSAKIYLIIMVAALVVQAVYASIESYLAFHKAYDKKIKRDIDDQEMRQLEQRVADFLKKRNLKPNDSIYTKAKALKIYDENEQFYEMPDRAELIPDGEHGKMIVRHQKGLTAEERLFDFAHECGHRINGDPVPITRPTGENKPEIEQLADYVGAALLMPIDEVSSELERSSYQTLSARKRLKVVRRLAEKYRVSQVVALRRVMEIYELKAN